MQQDHEEEEDRVQTLAEQLVSEEKKERNRRTKKGQPDPETNGPMDSPDDLEAKERDLEKAK